MKKDDQTVILSAADLVGHLNCNHLTALDLQVATGLLKKTNHNDPLYREAWSFYIAPIVSMLRSQEQNVW